MLKALIRKQMMEVFRMYFYDSKKKRGRSAGKVLFSFALFAFLMVIVMGGIFTGLSLLLCKPLSAAGMPWLYFTIMGMISVLFGAFGSVFNTYSALYLSKDNDFLLSMPIPVRTILASRVISVYLMSLMYSGVVSLPAVIVSLCVAGFSTVNLIRGLLFAIDISIFVLALSCILGWAVAKCSRKLKNKSFLTALIALVFIGLYYFFYAKAQAIIGSLVENAAYYGSAIQRRFHPLYLFGNAPLHWDVCVLLTALMLVLLALTAFIMEKTFLSIATDTGGSANARYREKEVHLRPIPAAMFSKEFKRFTSSANYMLNCGMGSVLLVIAAIALVWKGEALLQNIDLPFAELSSVLPIMSAIAICMIMSLNDTAAPSVSLEGKNLWMAQSMPIPTWEILRAKLRVQLAITLPCVLLLGCIAAAMFCTRFLQGILCVLLECLLAVLLAEIGLSIGLKTANVQWTNEVTPVKQSFGVFAAMFTGFLIPLIYGGLWFWFGRKLNTEVYLSICILFTLIPGIVLYRWLRSGGTKVFEAL